MFFVHFIFIVNLFLVDFIVFCFLFFCGGLFNRTFLLFSFLEGRGTAVCLLSNHS